MSIEVFFACLRLSWEIRSTLSIRLEKSASGGKNTVFEPLTAMCIKAASPLRSHYGSYDVSFDEIDHGNRPSRSWGRRVEKRTRKRKSNCRVLFHQLADYVFFASIISPMLRMAGVLDNVIICAKGAISIASFL